jgi:hypothetical protein
MSDAEWESDIRSVAELIRKDHPRAFSTEQEILFGQVTEQLIVDLPTLSDKQIIVHLATLVAMVNDGHTRLAIPRQHPEIGLEFGHKPTKPANHVEFAFAQLPVGFAVFEDGLFIVEANREHANLIGHEVISIDGTSAVETLNAVQAITYAENDSLEMLMGADRLTLVEALNALNLANALDTVQLELAAANGERKTISVNSLPAGPIHWVDAFETTRLPLRFKNPEKIFWSEYVSDGNYVYMQIDEIADGDITLAEFVVSSVALADAQDAKLVIDIRNNFGGSGGLNKSLVLSLLQNDELNQWGKTFVLTGRRTFSAAQMLANELEQYSRALYVGEPTGSQPDHYGDPAKTRLEHSGLTLRVSRLHWSSYTAFDERQSTNPDFPVSWTSAAYFGGQDPALELAASINGVDLYSLLENALERGDIHQVGRYTLQSKRAPDTFATDFSGMLLQLGDQFNEDGQSDQANIAYQVGLYFYPANEGLQSAFAAFRQQESVSSTN